jgi:uncharacterized iron-regulated membrane protein
LWGPRRWTRARLRNIAFFRRETSGKSRNFNWHHTIGAWSFLPLFVIVGSGVVMSYPWANALVYRVMGERPLQAAVRAEGQAASRQPETSRDRRTSVDGTATDDRGHDVPLTLDSAIALSQAQVPAWRSIAIQLPTSEKAKTLTASIDAGTGGQPQLRGSLTIDRHSAIVTRWESFATQSPGRRLRTILRFAHTGEVLGIAGQTIAGLVSLGTLLLAWTGIALALRRLWSWRRRRSLGTTVVQPPVEVEVENAA